ncbi:MAG TPA: hypothetical protein VNJ04_05130 [Gemmatimonadaceae bacterium]|nr:hypothetical protein [Gemmatimonadaceae bacterium]
MSSVYTPNAVALGNITLPSDGDARSAASVSAPLQALADGVKSNATRLERRLDIITASGTWTCPAGVTSVIVEGWGGGGSGGGGAAGFTSTISASSGGGGGGSGLPAVHVLTVVPSTTYNVIIGGGGISRAAALDGADGSASSFGTLAVFRGGAGGRAGVLLSVSATAEPIAPGGPTPAPIAGHYPISPVTALAANLACFTPAPGHGGMGSWGASILAMGAIGVGGGIPGGGGGGPGGGRGGASGSYYGGGAGGGGGGGNGYGATGPTGGGGGAANGAGGGTAGSAGSPALIANSGGGGSGGGGGGAGTALPHGDGGASGAGAAGKLIIVYNGPQAVIA